MHAGARCQPACLTHSLTHSSVWLESGCLRSLIQSFTVTHCHSLLLTHCRCQLTSFIHCQSVVSSLTHSLTLSLTLSLTVTVTVTATVSDFGDWRFGDLEWVTVDALTVELWLFYRHNITHATASFSVRNQY